MEKMVWRQVKEDKKYDQVLIFNTGRGYTENGQVIKCIKIDDLVYMVDTSRTLDYFYKCEFDAESIMKAYDNGEHTYEYTVPQRITAFEFRKSVVGW
jgi:hypothetical protein